MLLMMRTRKGRGNMKLKGIRAYGFKSFADKMEMQFKTNITAIVGPNGSGKSNIVDAVRWVLGEQSIKSLRGSNAMSDVIFAGSETRPPFKRCEVALSFDNTTHFLNTDLEDVEIKRILYYTGENEYFINNVKVRLKDITSLLLDSGIGNDSYNIISQGNIEAIINSKPVERRVILEGAAQVLKYKNRKLESLRKLEKTQDNLEKVNLIVQELEVSVLPLKEQSEVAKKYLAFQEELENLEIALTVHDIADIHSKYQEITSQIEELEQKKKSLSTENLTRSAKIEQYEAELLEIENKIEEENNRLVSLNERLAKLTSEKTLLLERQKYEVDADKINQNLLSLKEEEQKIQKQQLLLKEEIEELRKKKKDILAQTSLNDEEASLCEFQYKKFQSEKENALKKKLMLQNQIEILEHNIENDPGLSYAIKNVLNHPRLKGIHNTIGRLIETDAKYSVAIDTALSSAANFLVVDDFSAAQKAIEFLKENKLGRATFFPLDTISSRYVAESLISLAKKESGFLGIASDLVKYDPKYKSVIENQLGNVFVVAGYDSMEKVGKLLNYKYRVVTLDGEILHAGGSLTGGSAKKSISLLQMKTDLERTKVELQKLESRLKDYEEEETKFKQKLANIEEKEQEVTRQRIYTEDLLSQKEMNERDLEEKLGNISKQLAANTSLKKGNLEDNILGIMKTITEVEVEKELLMKKIQEYKNQKSEISSLIAGIETENKKNSSGLYQTEQTLKDLEISLGKMDTKMDYLLTVLSENYHMTYEKAKMDYRLEIESEIARMKVNSLRKEMKDLGTVNLGSIEEYERLSGRYEFLTTQKNDLEQACEELLKVIAEMDEIMVEKLKDAFDKIQTEFSNVFKKMFKGGTGKLVLTDPDNILETGIDIIAEPPGKKLNNIGLLSGGEKTLTAISLLFAILNVYPVPFCILDEVEAALDEANVDTFGKYLLSQKDKSEFILITHKKRTMEYADTLYGITMQEQGVSKVVSVKLEEKAV